MRRWIACAAMLACALGARAAPLGYEAARHLLVRTGFGATDAQVREYAALDREAAVDRLLAGARRTAIQAPPAFVDEPITPFRELGRLDPQERTVLQRQLVAQGLELRAWWLREMVETPSPLTERMTLFWHNHFATSQQKVRFAQLMYGQNALLRSEALGNFGAMLHAVAKDPAMLVWLDNARSRKEAPNENFAREVMELFTMGEGHYGERDVKEAARAFTGWSLEPDTGAYRYRPFFHDFGEKTVLGRTGRLNGDEVLDILLAEPATARFIAAKLWREFVSPVPDGKEVDRWAQVFRDAHYGIKPLLRTIFLSEAFWAPGHRASLVKSPVDIVVGTLHTFDVHPSDLRPAAFACAALGQNLFAPPNVKGWPGGDAWIDSATLLARKQFVDRLLRGADGRMLAPAPAPDDMAAVNAKGAAIEQPVGPALRRSLERGFATYAIDGERWLGGLGDPAAGRMESLLLAAAPVEPVSSQMPPFERVRAMLTDAAYQLR